MVRLYEEHEIHRCETCGLMLRVTFAAVPIEPLTCCGKEMVNLGVKEDISDLDLQPAQPVSGSLDKRYLAGEVYTCSICGIEVTILREAQPVEPLDCCGEGMELLRGVSG